MAVVTDLQYALENKLLAKLDLMILRCVQKDVKKDALLINEGSEGEGKTNTSCAEAYYIKFKTSREIHMFFRLEAMIDFAKKNKDKIIIWDEPSLDSLGADQIKKINRNLLRLFMTIRKRRHFFILNYTKLYKFPEYTVVDRALGMVHMYSRKEITPGRFVYVKKSNLEKLWNEYRSTKKRNYRKLRSFGGGFPEVMEKCGADGIPYFNKMIIKINGIFHATLKNEEDNKDLIAFKQLKKKIGLITYPIKNIIEMAKWLHTTRKSIDLWGKIEVKTPPRGIKELRKLNFERNMNNNGIDDEDDEVLPDESDDKIEDNESEDDGETI